MTWFELADENLGAAKLLTRNGKHRSAVSRAYYAAYAAMTGLFAPDHSEEFTQKGNNPGHQQLEMLVKHNLPAERFVPSMRKSLSRAFANLLKARVDADYVPGRTIDKQQAMDALRFANLILKELEITHG